MKHLLIALMLLPISSAYAESATYRVQFNANGHYTSTSDSGVSCGLLAGDNRNGLIMAGGSENRTLRRIESYNSNSWTGLASPPVRVHHITGGNRYGPIIAGGFNNRSVMYMNSYSTNQWTSLPEAPFEVRGLAGDNRKGPIITNGYDIAILESYANPQWTRIYNPNPGITTITGDNQYGIVVGGSNWLSFIHKYALYQWNPLPLPPEASPIVSLAGSVSSGVIAHLQNGSVWYLHFSVKGQGAITVGERWFRVETASLSRGIKDRTLIGDVSNGIAFCQY